MTNSYSRVRLALFFIISLALAQTWATDTSPSGGSESGSGVLSNTLDYDFDLIEELSGHGSSYTPPLDHDFFVLDAEKIDELLHKFGLKAGVKDPDKIVFGPEFTFWVPARDEFGNVLENGAGNDYPHEELAEVAQVLKEELKDFTATNTSIDVWDADFVSPNGWHFNVMADPGVIEVTMAPMTVEKYTEHKDDIQESVFDNIEGVGYFPSLYGGGGHISISMAYFKKRPLLFRNFIVDLINHGELFLGVFGFDTNNALSPLLVQQDDWDGIVHELEILDRTRFSYDMVEEFLMFYSNVMHHSKDPYMRYWREGARTGRNMPRGKYHAIEFKRKFKTVPHRMDTGTMGSISIPTALDDRIELRAVRAQASADVWVRQIRLLEKRIKYLETFKGPMPLKPLFDLERYDSIPNSELKDLALNVPIKPQAALYAFYLYVTESGEKWEDHQDYLWPAWIENGEVEKFNESLCSSLLE